MKQLFVDHAVSQVSDYHFDGLRFDFTEPIKTVGGKAGWEMLREINRQLHFLQPGTFTMAEQFDYDPNITEPSGPHDQGGGGFDAQWYTEFQHRLVNDSSNPGIIQAAANGQKTNIDGFMNLLTNPRGIGGWDKAVSMISNHDEVGNATRTIDVADGASTSKIPDDWARGAARFAAGMGFTGPGTPMFFQGDESMAQNSFKWGIPGTWDLGWDWQKLGAELGLEEPPLRRRAAEDLRAALPALRRGARERPRVPGALPRRSRRLHRPREAAASDQREQAMLGIHRRQSVEFYKAAIALRKSSPAFAADAEVKRLYTHNDDSVLAFSRKAGNDEFVVVGSLNQSDLSGYRLELPPGQWKEVFNSDAQAFGGSNFGNEGGTFGGGSQPLESPRRRLLRAPEGGLIRAARMTRRSTTPNRASH